MASVFHRFFDILLTKVGISTKYPVLCVTFLHQGLTMKNGEDLHFMYAMQISERLARIVQMWDPSFEYGALGNPFVVRQLSNHLRI